MYKIEVIDDNKTVYEEYIESVSNALAFYGVLKSSGEFDQVRLKEVNTKEINNE